MRQLIGVSLGQTLERLSGLESWQQPRLAIFSAADDQVFLDRIITAAWPLPFNGCRLTVETKGPGGVMTFTWTRERRQVQVGETPLSAIFEDV